MMGELKAKILEAIAKMLIETMNKEGNAGMFAQIRNSLAKYHLNK